MDKRFDVVLREDSALLDADGRPVVTRNAQGKDD